MCSTYIEAIAGNTLKGPGKGDSTRRRGMGPFAWQVPGTSQCCWLNPAGKHPSGWCAAASKLRWVPVVRVSPITKKQARVKRSHHAKKKARLQRCESIAS